MRVDVSVSVPAPELVGAPYDHREAREHEHVARRHRRGLEDRLEWGCVDDRGGERDREPDTAQQVAVAEQADLVQRGAAGAHGERGAQLAGDDPGPGHRRRPQIGVMKRGPGASRLTR
jgi:hypothetical protein